MSQDLDKFLEMIDEAETTPKVAPFGLDTNQQVDNKITFLTCRAKNFRSIGNEFMGLDFSRNKSTLIVSDDNGSGKSTLAIWAPYFALTGKPYAPKEKMEALVNSATKKDCVVELEFYTKGKNFLIRRGYKPSLFEIHHMVDGEWCKIDEQAALADQQKYLESILGFDSKIIENVMILGTDKFTPFIEMDSPSRRHVVETIWDLAIFPIMLDLAKKEWAISNRKHEESCIEFDKYEIEKRHITELKEELESHTSSIEEKKLEITNLGTEISLHKQKLTDIMVEYETTIEPLMKAEIELQSQLESMKTNVMNDRAKAVSESEGNLTAAKLEVDSRIKQVRDKFQGEISQVRDNIEKLVAANTKTCGEQSDEAAIITKALEEEIKLGEELGETKESEIILIRGVYIDEEFENFKVLNNSQTEDCYNVLEGLRSVSRTHQADFKRCSIVHSEILNEINSVTKDISMMKSQRESLESKLKDLEHLGTCPTCSQSVTPEAVEMVRQSMKGDFDKVDSAQLEVLLSDLIQKRDDEKSKLDSLSLSITDTESKIELENERFGSLTNDLLAATNTFNDSSRKYQEETVRQVAEAKANCLSEAQSKLYKHIADTNTKLNNLKSEHQAIISVENNKLSTLLSDENAEVSKVTMETRENITNLTNIVENINQVFKNKYLEVTANVRQALTDTKAALTVAENAKIEKTNSTNAALVSFESRLTSTRSSLVSSEDYVAKKRNELETKDSENARMLDKLGANIKDLSNQLNVSKFIINELGDKAAKADIIKAYLPYMNGKVNEYLEAMNLFVGFKMDENFNVKFTSPDRKGQTTASLSKGQLARMNLSVLFALRDVANLKASVNSNILILDEILEPLSSRGVKEVTEMINHKFQSMNVFVVSQRADEFAEHFQHVINYGLRGGFTTVL